MDKGNVRKLKRSELEMILSWRNHPNVRRYMFSQEIITLDEHLKWYDTAVENSCKHLLIYELDGTSQGFINFSVVKESKIADWGFYASPTASKGIGTLLGLSALNYAFKEMALHKVCGQVLAFNQKSMGLHRKLGFKEEGMLREQSFTAGVYHSIYLYGLLASEWT
ncbi:UDP-4-amino-4,6-dideoxy-N-acetyl-beta-L-altrosamine N-acetyltransferase [Pseudomonas sp. TTU2014-080ASC]|uniref:UDP-4-amino-4, 6-dideoxy-N-acetyl-beta-L-altrosamine N-acetyltransferase n=1 Tax=Pseudomonas sp. TTU2014-080ASC TaxID=1729724 RepID=UPI0007185CC9|nr:UDP-4-amino-4,6-dideoxy-N-acetyl-beta-L-altrosamine N-acetyltransferase [Pseudomonas sp. TTU2014-080ASC]KRW62286.1 UDP-4-amino-4,6-dideoxy-N-acetyl-beta-L-altrosamine N-acetyltransferase [Pseudomonas sp. TTU2014-080ASC]